jgi:hypothetical protein
VTDPKDKEPAKKCGAQRRNGLGPCNLAAGHNTSHLGYGRCSWHGGSAPGGTRAAAREAANAQARAILADLDAPPVTNALLALQHLAGEAESWRAACARLVNRLGEDEIRYSGRAGGMQLEQVRAEIGMYTQAMSQSGTLLIALSKLDIDARLVAIEEQKAQRLAQILDAALAAARLDEETLRVIRAVYVRGLRALAAEYEQGAGDEDAGAVKGLAIPPPIMAADTAARRAARASGGEDDGGALTGDVIPPARPAVAVFPR